MRPPPCLSGETRRWPEIPTEVADELLVDGQEEVFSRSEIDSGRIEHHVGVEPVSGRAGEEKKNQTPQSPGLRGRTVRLQERFMRRP